MAIAVAVLASLAFIGWLIYRAIKGRPFKAHTITYGVAEVAGVYTYAFFLSMDIPQLVKIVVSIILGMILIFVAAYVQRRRQMGKA
ncbi:MAG TPA: hypothetical protein VMW00_02770 [Dehalococcoidales bacterium]|nr:hypothetical protein [Dehalococcoidales bacterium]